MKQYRVRQFLVTLLAALALSPLGFAQASEKEPGAGTPGKRYSWTAENGLGFEYVIPKGYDPDVGANLTFILHGSNLDRRWGFANHEPGKFRPDDIVVSPDGTTSNGQGGFNSLQRRDDLERLHDLHQELRTRLNVRDTFLYGHSQGSFFAFYYAGAYPEDVAGVVGHASGVWIGTKGGPTQHHQAIVLMHGTADPVVPYRQSVGSLSAHFEKLGYPMARLRSLDGWNHWPSQHHASQQLAWCEGMTSADPE
ncbi:MAG: alpha/beta fold hydrolase, partial [Planctomycetota bacterium]